MKHPQLLRQIHIMVFAITFGALFILTCRFESDSADLHTYEHRKPYNFSQEFGKLTAYKRVPLELECFVRDCIPFRGALITARNEILYKLWGKSGSNSVIIGKNNTLFCCYKDNYYPDDVAGVTTRLFTDEQLKKQANYFMEVNDWLSCRGIRYALVVVPSKQTIYPELLPDGSNQVIHCTRADQLISHLKSHSNVSIVDVRDEIRKHKEESPLYYKYDTHWNTIGGYHAYNFLISKLQALLPTIKPISAPYHLLPYIRDTDLGSMTRLAKFLYEPSIQVCRAPIRFRKFWSGGEEVTVTADKSAPRTLVYHDSMFYSMMPFFADHFSVARYITSYSLDPKDFSKYSPDLVVQEMSEGNLSNESFNSPVSTLLAEERFKRGYPLVSFDDADKVKMVNCKRSQEVRLLSVSSTPHATLTCLTDDPGIQFFAEDASCDRVLKASIEVSEPDHLQLFYAGDKEQFTERSSTKVLLEKGKNEISLNMPRRYSYFRLDPCTRKGDVRLSFQVISVGSPKMQLARKQPPDARTRKSTSAPPLY